MLIILDAGHGGSDPGAVYNGRQEKDDNLKLAMEVGKLLEARGVNVAYTRTTDIYETPFKKATDGNEAGADYFVSFHRNSGERAESASGVQNLIYAKGGKSEELAKNIQARLIKLGFRDLGIIERPNLVVLKRTKMPAVLIETGFINNSQDNQKFDEEFDKIALAIAEGILETIGFMESVKGSGVDYDDSEENVLTDNYEEISEKGCCCKALYRVQTGAFRNRDNADRMLASLLADGFPAFIIFEGGLYKVQVGAYKRLDNAVRMERKLRMFNYSTYITT